MTNSFIPKIPLDQWVETFIDYLVANFENLFEGITWFIEGMVSVFEFIFTLTPSLVTILIFAGLAWFLSTRGIAFFTLVGLLLVDNLGYWDNTMLTLSLVLTSAIISVAAGIPLGISSARNNKVRQLITPVLDFMQTMPAFVYLIPAIFFFGIGTVPGVIASVIFAMPPVIRLTNLGIRQVPKELVEAADAFGSTPRQKLWKVQIPLAMPTMMAGINQSIMLSLSMVVIASMIGAQGLGADVYRAVTQIQVGTGFEAGLAIVILAIMLDRITQYIGKSGKEEK